MQDSTGYYGKIYETVVCICGVCLYLFFNHELMTLHHQLKFVPFGSEGADGVQTSTRHGAQQPVLLLRLLELRQNLHTTSKQQQYNIYTQTHH